MRLKFRDSPSPCYFYDRAAFLQVFVANVYGGLLQFISRGDVVIDCGANIGCFAIAASERVGSSGLVIAVEPEPGNLSVLRENIQLLGLSNVRIIPKALSRSADEDIEIVGEGLFAHVGLGGSPVRSTTLSAIVREFQIDQLAAIKMDIEGSESDALAGAEVASVLEMTRAFQVEVQSSNGFEEIASVLSKAGLTHQRGIGELEFLPLAILRSAAHPGLVPRLYRGHFNSFLSRLWLGVLGTLRPNPAQEQGFVSTMLLASRG